MKKQKLNNHNDNSPSDNGGADYVVLAEIMGAHGVRGLVKIRCYADDISLIEQSSDLKITLKNQHKGELWLAHVDGVQDRDAAEALRGTKITLHRDQLPDIDPDDDGYYFTDLVGCIAITPDEEKLGDVIAVENFGASDLLEIKPKAGESFYVAFTDENVPNVDLDTKRITVIKPQVF